MSEPPPPQEPPGGYPPPPPPANPPPPSYAPYAASYAAVAPVNDTMAIWSLVLGILSLACCWAIVLGPVAFFLGQASLGRIRRSGGTLTGEGLAMAGWITGAIATALWVLIALVVIGAAIASNSAHST